MASDEAWSSQVAEPNQAWRFPTRLILVDFDETLGKFAWPGVPDEPYPGVVEGLKRLAGQGFIIFIFTTRVWPGWIGIDGREFYDRTRREMVEWLDRWGVPYHGITHEKVPCKFIIDDRALNPSLISWGRIVEIIEGSGSDPYGKSREAE